MDFFAEKAAKLAARRTPSEIEQERRNKEAAEAWARKPRSEKPMTSCAFTKAGKYTRNEEAIAFFSQDPATRGKGAEPTVADLRKEVQESHPDRGGSAEKFIAAKKRLDKARGRK